MHGATIKMVAHILQVYPLHLHSSFSSRPCILKLFLEFCLQVVSFLQDLKKKTLHAVSRLSHT